MNYGNICKKAILSAVSAVLLLSAPLSAAAAGGDGSRLTVGLSESADITEMKVYPGGQTFGIKLQTDGVLVVGVGEVSGPGGNVTPAADAGIKAGDIITAVGDEPVDSILSLNERISESEGKSTLVTFERDGISHTVCPIPVDDGKGYKIGVWVRDSTAGIGTLTYIIPETLAFGGLGHGIYDSDTGILMPMKRGCVSDVILTGIKKGKAGAPGELQGYVASQTTLYDKNKAISAAEQSTWRPSIVFNNIKKHLVDVGEKYNMTFDEEKLNKCVKRLMDMAVDYNQNDWLPEIRTILMEELDMPRELVYLQIVAGDTFIMLNEIKWGGSEAIMAAVGQSITTVTPVEMARYVAAVANGGKVYDLRLIDSIISPDGEVLSESTPILASEIEGEGVQEYLAALRKGMSGVTGDDGTAAKFYKGEYADVGAKMGAKTGTAEKTTIDLENNAWMVAFAPFDDPQIAVCVYIPHGYSGSYCSITIREVLNYYLEHMGLDGEDTMPPSNSLAY